MNKFKKGDLLLIQIISSERYGGGIKVETVSYCFELNNNLCTYFNGFVLELDEMKGSTITKLDISKDIDIIKKHSSMYNDVHIRIGSYDHKPYCSPNRFNFYNGEIVEFNDAFNDSMIKHVSPWSKILK